MLSLGEDILPTAPGVRAPTFTRRASHLSLNEAADPRVGRSNDDLPRLAGRLALPRPGQTKNSRLAQLAEQIRQLHTRYRTPLPHCSSGLPALDDALGGGFALGAVHELVAASEGAPAVSLALWTATQAAGRNQSPSGSVGRTRWIFYIDTQHELYPPAVAQLGVPLGRLMVVRASRTTDALWVCEQALRCQAVAAVVLPLRTIDAYASRRLQLAAEAGQSLGLLICRDQPDGHTFAASRLRIQSVSHPDHELALARRDGAPLPRGARHLLITILKLREGRPSEPLVVEWPDAADSVPASAVPVDAAGAARRCASG
jgi:protein ImuA